MLHQGRIDSVERIVVLVMDNGLKDVDSAIEATGNAHVNEPETEAVRNVLTDLAIA
jgi:hypothetical protein